MLLEKLMAGRRALSPWSDTPPSDARQRLSGQTMLRRYSVHASCFYRSLAGRGFGFSTLELFAAILRARALLSQTGGPGAST